MKQRSAIVVQKLLDEMNELVFSYPEGVTPPERTMDGLIDGTAFFPGGTGLWRGVQCGGELPEHFPQRPVMFIAYNFGDLASFLQGRKDRGEAHSAFQNLWKNLLGFVSAAYTIKLNDCFFTNAYMGFKSDGRSGEVPSTEQFKNESIMFLAAQTRIVNPKCVVLLGDKASALWEKAARLDSKLRLLPAGKVMHPSARPKDQLPTQKEWLRKQGQIIAELIEKANAEGATKHMPNTQQQPAKMWSGRFREPLNRTFEQWQRSFPFDWRLLPQEVAASQAHARTIAAAGILTPDELAKTLQGLEAVGTRTQNWAHRISATSGEVDYDTSTQQIGAAIVASAPQAEDIHHYVELELTREIGALALKLHTGRSRNEQIATDMRLFVRDAIDHTLTGLRHWLAALITLAEASNDAVMPGYTHLQRAEPVLIAHWLLAYVAMLERDYSRFTDARARMNFCPLGSGAIAGATLALDRTIASDALGFTAPTPNSMDATSDRDFMLDFAQAASTLGLHISRFAEELTLYATAEFGFVDLPEAFSTGSSAMPQKKNPDLTELARGKSARLLGASTALSTLIKGLPLAYNKDLQEGQEQIFDIADTLAGLLSVLPSFTRALRFKSTSMEAAAQHGYLNAMAAATYLSNKGVPFRKAHEIVGNAVRLGLDRGCELNQLSLEDLQKLSPDFAADVFTQIDLQHTLDCHDVPGGTATHRVADALTAAKARHSQLSARSSKLIQNPTATDADGDH